MHPSFLHRRVALIAGLCAALFATSPLRAEDDPAPALLATINSVVDLVVGQPPEVIQQRLPDIRARMSDKFAIDVLVRRAFGRNWQQLSADQQAKLVDLLGLLIIRTYAMQLSSGERPVITITASREIDAGHREITSTVAFQGDTINVVYRLGLSKGDWKVYDVLAEGVSVVGNYRQQFDSFFQKGTAADLIGMIEEKLAKIPAVEKGD